MPVDRALVVVIAVAVAVDDLRCVPLPYRAGPGTIRHQLQRTLADVGERSREAKLPTPAADMLDRKA
jgi:hypothetical protein